MEQSFEAVGAASQTKAGLFESGMEGLEELGMIALEAQGMRALGEQAIELKAAGSGRGWVLVPLDEKVGTERCSNRSSEVARREEPSRHCDRGTRCQCQWTFRRSCQDGTS